MKTLQSINGKGGRLLAFIGLIMVAGILALAAIEPLIETYGLSIPGGNYFRAGDGVAIGAANHVMHSTLAVGRYNYTYDTEPSGPGGGFNMAVGFANFLPGTMSAAVGYCNQFWPDSDSGLLIGYANDAYGTNNFLSGKLNVDYGAQSSCLGEGNIGSQENSTAVGQFSQHSWATSPVRLFMVGNGTGPGNGNGFRRNAMVIYDTGDVHVPTGDETGVSAIRVWPAGDLAMGTYNTGIKPDEDP